MTINSTTHGVSALPAIKTMSGLYNYLYNHSVHDINILRWRSLYQVTVGTHDDNIFMTVDLSGKTINWCKRRFNGKNYDAGYSHTEYMTMAGREKLIDFLNNEITQAYH